MIVKNRDLGTIEIPEDDIIYFPEGIYGFSDIKKYVLLSQEDSAVMWLQAAERETPCFIVFDPFAVIPGYEPCIADESQSILELQSPEDVMSLIIAVVPDDFRKTTVNLKSPILINCKNHKAMQILQADNNYSIRHPLFDSYAEV